MSHKSNSSKTLRWLRRIKYVVFALVHAAWVLLLCHMLGDKAYSLGDEEQFVQHLYFMKESIFPSEIITPSNLLAVNIAYDKQLTAWNDEYGLPAGEIAITDRRKLLQFLQLAKKSNNYSYILLDIYFESGIET